MDRSKGEKGGFAGTLGLGALAATSLILAWQVAGLDLDVRPMPQPSLQQPGSAIEPRGGDVSTASVLLVPRSLTAFSGTLDRPLFEPTRRPRPAIVDPVEPGPPVDAAAVAADSLRIVGIMNSKGGSAVVRALVRSTDAPQAVWVEPGASIGGWKGASIGDRTVTVESGSQRHELSLFQASSLATGAPRSGLSPVEK